MRWKVYGISAGVLLLIGAAVQVAGTLMQWSPWPGVVPVVGAAFLLTRMIDALPLD